MKKIMILTLLFSVHSVYSKDLLCSGPMSIIEYSGKNEVQTFPNVYHKVKFIDDPLLTRVESSYKGAYSGATWSIPISMTIVNGLKNTFANPQEEEISFVEFDQQGSVKEIKVIYFDGSFSVCDFPLNQD